MRLRSFRLRLALWSAALTGVALIGFASAVAWQMRHDKIVTLDRELRLYTEREASHPSPPPDYWQHIETVLNNMFSHLVADSVVLFVESDQHLDYQSTHWPSEIDVNSLPWSTLELPQAAMRNDMPPFPPPPPQDANQRHFPPFMGHRPPPHLALPPAIISQLATSTTTWRFGVITTPFMRLAIGVNIAVIDNEMTTMRNAFLLAVPLALLLIGIGAAILSSRALAPLRRLTTTMQQITVKGLHQRIALGTEDKEFSQLISVFNDMLQRLERSFLQASRFSADAAHELRTPLAILQGQIEQTMNQVEAGSLVQIRLSSILDEIQRLSTISRKLLLLSLADAGRLRLHKVRFNLSQALNELIEDAQMLAPQLEVSGNIAPNLLLEVDADLLRQVLHNLISNAIKYNAAPVPSQGKIHIAACYQQRIEITISNTAENAANIDQTRLFERFYRADPAHGRHIEGVGLGLSLSREIAIAHGGDLQLKKADAGEVVFLLVL